MVLLDKGKPPATAGRKASGLGLPRKRGCRKGTDMRDTGAAKIGGGNDPGQRFVVFVAPGLVRILRALPLARGWNGEDDGATHLHERGSDGSQAPIRSSAWAEAAEGFPPGLYYLH
jgi:hypothetical protein